MATDMKRAIERVLKATDHRGRPLVARITIEGIYLKVKGQRWESAVFQAWGSVYTHGSWRKAEDDKKAKAAAKLQRKQDRTLGRL